jgi:putative ABC transport system ATP-binding protein
MIKFQNISIKFNEKIIFNDFNLIVEKGQKCVITGNSGVGKSTVFNLILGFAKQDDGVVLINDLEVNPQNINKIRKEISFIPQNVNLPFDTALELFNSLFLYSKIAIPEKKVIEDVFNDFNLEYKILEQLTSSLSGGEKQRLLLISSILTNKKILLWDEPTSAIDQKNKEVLVKYMEKIPEITILSISHDDFWIKNVQKVVKL